MRPFFESVRVKIWRGRTCASAWSVWQAKVVINACSGVWLHTDTSKACDLTATTRPRRVISYKTRGLWSHQKRTFLTPISCYDKRTSKTRVFGGSKARVKNTRFIGNHTSRTPFWYTKPRVSDAHSPQSQSAVKSHAFDVSVCNQTPEQAFMTTLACHRSALLQSARAASRSTL